MRDWRVSTKGVNGWAISFVLGKLYTWTISWTIGLGHGELNFQEGIQ